MSKLVYLAGPILGCTEGEAKNWRKWVADQLEPLGITCISPLRCEPLIDAPKYGLVYADPSFGTKQAIAAKNLYDVRRCDLTLAWLPLPPEGRRQSYGTIVEFGVAFEAKKAIILVSDDPNVAGHPLLGGIAGWTLDSLTEAVRCISGIMGPVNV